MANVYDDEIMSEEKFNILMEKRRDSNSLIRKMHAALAAVVYGHPDAIPMARAALELVEEK